MADSPGKDPLGRHYTKAHHFLEGLDKPLSTNEFVWWKERLARLVQEVEQETLKNPPACEACGGTGVVVPEGWEVSGVVDEHDDPTAFLPPGVTILRKPSGKPDTYTCCVAAKCPECQ